MCKEKKKDCGGHLLFRFYQHIGYIFYETGSERQWSRLTIWSSVSKIKKLFFMSTGKRKKRSKKKSSTSTGTRSSTGLSPEVKKSKNQDETEDEVFQVLNMAADVASKLQCITDKLDKLGPIEEKIDKLTSSIQAVENKIFKLDKDVADLKAKYIQIDEGLNNMNLDLEELKEWRTRTEDDQYDSNRELMDDLETIKQNILYALKVARKRSVL